MSARAMFIVALLLPCAIAEQRRHLHKPHIRLRGASSGTIVPRSTPNSETPIHLSISAFQDGDRCAKTIKFALENAQNPERLSFGVLQARGQHDHDCLDSFDRLHLEELCNDLLSSMRAYQHGCRERVLSQINGRVIKPQDGEGPGHQRGLMNDMINFDRPDKFCMQTDSHMDFLSHWDNLLIDDWRKTHNEFAVLTAYVMDLSAKEDHAMDWMVDCCGWKDDGDGMPRGNQCGDVERTETPVLTMNWAAGFSFHRCHAEKNVPIDKHLRWIFTGEEIDRAARLWTSGYDLYLPTRGFVLHNYTHATQNFWNYGSEEIDAAAAKSHAKLSALLELGGHSSAKEHQLGHYYTLGTQRTLQQWKDFIEPAYNKPGAQFCTADVHLRRVPVADLKALERSATLPTPHEV